MHAALAVVPSWVLMRLECPFPHVLALQCAAGDRVAGQPSLLAAADAAPREIPFRAGRALGESGGAIARTASAANYLGSRRLGRRGACGQWADWGVGRAFPAVSDSCLDHNRYGPEAGEHTLWRGKRLLLPSGFQLRHPALSAGAAPRSNRFSRN